MVLTVNTESSPKFHPVQIAYYLECIVKWCLISQYVTTKLSKAVKQVTAHWSKKLDPYWSIEDMKTNKSILSHPRRC